MRSVGRCGLAALACAGLSACAGGALMGGVGTGPPDLAAKTRSAEARCARLQPVTPRRGGAPPTRAEVQAEGSAAARRGELDKVCDWL